MEKLIFNLPYDDKKIHRQVVKFLNFAMGLTEQEQIVLAKLVEYNIEYKALDPSKRAKFILSTSIKKEICEAIDMKLSGFTQILLRLKRKKFFGNDIIDDEGVLHPSLIVTPDKEGLSIIISFAIQKTITETPIATVETPSEIQEDTVVNDEVPVIDKTIPTDYVDPMEGVEFEVNTISKNTM